LGTLERHKTLTAVVGRQMVGGCTALVSLQESIKMGCIYRCMKHIPLVNVVMEKRKHSMNVIKEYEESVEIA
jgi:hypothetical protein